MTSNYLKKIALELELKGYSLLPIEPNEKRPAKFLKNNQYFKSRANSNEIESWFKKGIELDAIGVANGEISGNLVTLDFDELGFFEIWYSSLSEELKKLVDKFHKTRTRSGCEHLRFKTESIQPTIKLATKKLDNNLITKAEVRGEGSYALIAPSKGYSNLSGDISKLEIISDETYNEILNTFKPFNESITSEKDCIEIQYIDEISDKEKPWGWMENNVSFDELLVPHGWTKTGDNYWKRPNKKDGGISASTNYNGLPIFYCFSSNASPFDPNKGYSKFGVYATLNYGGDKKLAFVNFRKDYPQYKSQFMQNSVSGVSSNYSRSLKPVHYSDIKKWEFPETSWWIENLIPKGAFVIIASISGEGKSWSAYTMAKNITDGENFLDQENFKTNKGNVLYIDAENSPQEIQRRTKLLSFKDNINFMCLPVSDLNMNNDAMAKTINEIIDEHKIDVIIIDTFRAVAGGLDENQANIVRTFFNRLKASRDKGSTFIFLDHYRKPNHFEGKTPKKEFLFGSQDKVAGVDIVIMLQKQSTEIHVYQVKNRLGNEINPFAMKMEDYVDKDNEKRLRIVYSNGEEIQKVLQKKDMAYEYILEILNSGKKTRKELIDICKKEINVGERNVDNALNQLVLSGQILKANTENGHEYGIASVNLFDDNSDDK